MSQTPTPSNNTWGSPKGILTIIIVLTVIWGIFNPERVRLFLNDLFITLVDQVLPIVIVVAVIVWIGKTALKK